jgi:hypothetical protein
VNSPINISFDNETIASTTSDALGNFSTDFTVPTNIALGPHLVEAVDAANNTAASVYYGFAYAAPVAPMDITGGPNGLPDGKVDIKDIALVAKYFGAKDPDFNTTDPSDPPPTTQTLSLKDASPGLLAFVDLSCLRRIY